VLMRRSHAARRPPRRRVVACLRPRSHAAGDYAFLTAGTGIPAILRFTEPRKFQLVKQSVFQSGPPKARFVVCGWPWTMRPSFLPLGSRIQRPPEPPQKTFPAVSTFMPSGTPGSAPPSSANTRSVCRASAAVRRHVEGADVAAACHFFPGRPLRAATSLRCSYGRPRSWRRRSSAPTASRCSMAPPPPQFTGYRTPIFRASERGG
jgi:hypothetical protein